MKSLLILCFVLGATASSDRTITTIGVGSVPVKPYALQVQAGVQLSTIGTNWTMTELKENLEARATFIVQTLYSFTSSTTTASTNNNLTDNSTTNAAPLDPNVSDVFYESNGLTPIVSDGESDDNSTTTDYLANFTLAFKVKFDAHNEVFDRVVCEQGANMLQVTNVMGDAEVEKEAHLQSIELASLMAYAEARRTFEVFGLQGNLRLLKTEKFMREEPMEKGYIVRAFQKCVFDFDNGTMDVQEGREVELQALYDKEFKELDDDTTNPTDNSKTYDEEADPTAFPTDYPTDTPGSADDPLPSAKTSKENRRFGVVVGVPPVGVVGVGLPPLPPPLLPPPIVTYAPITYGAYYGGVAGGVGGFYSPRFGWGRGRGFGRWGYGW